MKIINERTDILTRKAYPREELSRFIAKEGTLVYDRTGKLPGRGVYLAKGHGAEAIRLKAFLRYLHRPLNKEEEELLSRL